MRVSLVIRSKDEADRLRLTLTSLSRQAEPAEEVIVVNDGSTDHTPAVLAEAAPWLPLRSVTHDRPLGRAGAANAGAAIAAGDLLLFLDGDTLAHPELVARHRARHRGEPGLVGRGETFHLRGTRFLQDPETGAPRPEERARLARLPAAERDRLRVTRAELIEDFPAIDRRAAPATYPGAGPGRLYEVEMDALRHHPGCAVLWAAASGANLSVAAPAFRAVGGFDARLDINEHRELALRLCRRGLRLAAVDGARSYHLTHRSGWRDPLRETGWERIFYAAHPILAVKLLAVFWAGFSAGHAIPPEALIASLPELAEAATGARGIDYDAVRRRIPGLPELPGPASAPAEVVA